MASGGRKNADKTTSPARRRSSNKRRQTPAKTSAIRAPNARRLPNTEYAVFPISAVRPSSDFSLATAPSVRRPESDPNQTVRPSPELFAPSVVCPSAAPTRNPPDRRPLTRGNRRNAKRDSDDLPKIMRRRHSRDFRAELKMRASKDARIRHSEDVTANNQPEKTSLT